MIKRRVVRDVPLTYVILGPDPESIETSRGKPGATAGLCPAERTIDSYGAVTNPWATPLAPRPAVLPPRPPVLACPGTICVLTGALVKACVE